MKLFWILAFWLALANASRSETVVVQSEDKNDFSRLSFVLPNPAPWQLEKTANGYDIIFSKMNDEIDVSEIFKNMSRRRIQTVSALDNGSRIRIELACECEAQAYEYRPGFLTVKIIGEGAEIAGDNLPQQSPPAMPFFGDAFARQDLPRVGVFASHQPETKEPIAAAQIREQDKRISDIRGQVLRQLSKAASQGLLETKMLPERTEIVKIQGTSPIKVEESEPVEDVSSHVNIHVETSVDRERSQTPVSQNLTDQGATCLRDDVLDISTWGDSDAIFDRIALERGKITLEFDQVDQKALTRFIQANLYAGFGAEAIAAYRAFDAIPSTPKILARLAEIMDDNTYSENKIFDDQIGCDGRSALWAALSINTLATAPFINRPAVIQSFAELPSHLRKLLGPRLAKKFVDIGDIRTARTLRNAIVRTNGEPTSEMKLLEAQLNHERGLERESTTLLEEVIAEDGTFSITALIARLDDLTRRRQDIDSELLLTAQAMVFEQRETDQGAALQALIIVAQGQKNMFPQAVHSLNELELSSHTTLSQKAKMWGSLLQEATEYASADDFIQLVYATQKQLSDFPISSQTRLLAAKRLISEGIPSLAKEMIQLKGQPSAEEALILAEIAIAEGDPEKAILLIENQQKEPAIRLRAQAYRLLGQVQKAIDEYSELLDQRKVDELLWEIGDWQKIALVGGGIEKVAAQLMQTDLSDQNDMPNGLIARAQASLENSKKTQIAMTELMEKYGLVRE